jgi:putative membrane protein
MKGFIVGVIATAITFAIVSYLLPQIDYKGSIQTLIVVSLIAGVVNGFIAPVVKALSLPISMMTMGLFGIVVNAVLLLLIAWISTNVAKFDFTVGGFPPTIDLDAITAAVIGSVAIGLVGSVVGLVVRD